MFVPLAIVASASGCHRTGAGNAVTAIEGPCDNAAPHAAEIACRDRIAEASHARMLQALEANRRNARALDAEYDAMIPNHATDGHRPLLVSLDESQAAWERYSEAQCHYEADKSFGGSGGWDFEAECKDRLNRQRLAELNALLATDRARGATMRN